MVKPAFEEPFDLESALRVLRQIKRYLEESVPTASDGADRTYDIELLTRRNYGTITTELSPHLERTDNPHGVTWEQLEGRPDTFPPDPHTHLWADILDRPTTFTPSPHTHVWADIEDAPEGLPPAPHTHSWSEINLPNPVPFRGLDVSEVNSLKFSPQNTWASGNEIETNVNDETMVFKLDGTEVATIEFGGLDLSFNTSVVTREKGDIRYAEKFHSHHWGAIILPDPVWFDNKNLTKINSLKFTAQNAWASGNEIETNVDDETMVFKLDGTEVATIEFGGPSLSFDTSVVTREKGDARYAPLSYVYSWDDIVNKPTTFTPAVHTHVWADITDKPDRFEPDYERGVFTAFFSDGVNISTTTQTGHWYRIGKMYFVSVPYILNVDTTSLNPNSPIRMHLPIVASYRPTQPHRIPGVGTWQSLAAEPAPGGMLIPYVEYGRDFVVWRQYDPNTSPPFLEVWHVDSGVSSMREFSIWVDES